MKRKLVAILTMCIILCASIIGLTACSGGSSTTGGSGGKNPPAHVHTFNNKNIDSYYLKRYATCTQKAIYYYSCSCGERGASTFEYGSSLGHDYGDYVSNGDGTHTKTCSRDNTHIITENCNGGTASCINKAICVNCDTEYGDLEEHKYLTLKYNETEHWKECECGDKSDIKNHIPGDAATETTNQICTECEYIIATALGHVHTLHLTKVDAIQQSCIKVGNIEYYTCSCGKWFTDSTATTEIFDKDSVVIEKDKHNHTLEHNETQHWYECICGDKINIEDHKGGTATCTERAKCSVCETTYGNLKGHEYTIIKHNETEHWNECICGDKINIEDHKGGTATCTEKAKCSVCETAYGNLKDHEHTIIKYNETQHWYECSCGDKASAENHKGGTATETAKAKCSVCGQAYGELLEKQATEGLVFTLINNDTEYEVSDYTGSSTEVYIPTTYDNKPVTTIGEEAFYSCDSLTSIIIPDSVISIGDYAFAWCDSLTSVTIGNSVTTIGDYAFEYCELLTNITIPDSVTSIGDHAFIFCDSLTSVTIGNSVTTIGDCAFEYCELLTNITIPDSVISIGRYAFYGCPYTVNKNLNYFGNKNNPYLVLVSVVNYNLSTYTINTNTKFISNYAFSGCESLTSITIPDSVISIGDYAFYDCTSLTSVIIGDGVTFVGEEMFYDCDSLTSVTIGNSVTTIGDRAFCNCWSLTNITIPDSVTSIGDHAFAWCDSLTSVTIGNSVTTIGDYAFEYCELLTNITIPDSVTTIGDYAFEYCELLTNITIPDSVTSIGDHAFIFCDSLQYNVKDGLEYLGNDNNKYLYLADTVSTSITTANIDINCKIIGWNAFEHCSRLTSITVNENNANYKSIDGNLYSKDGKTLIKYAPGKKAMSFTIPNTVTSIGNAAFSYCESLTSITIPDSVTSIGEDAFYKCSSLKSIAIPNSVTSIGNDAFYNCDSLTSITIGDSVTSIGEDAFYSCDSLTNVTFKNPNGWWRSSSSTATSGKNISSADLSNTSTAAKYLSSTYHHYYWRRG